MLRRKKTMSRRRKKKRMNKNKQKKTICLYLTVIACAGINQTDHTFMKAPR